MDTRAFTAARRYLLLLAVAAGPQAGCGGGTPEAGDSTALAGDGGGPDVVVLFNHSPVITSLSGNERVRPGAQAVEVDLEIQASDADGDELAYAWKVTGCQGADLTLPEPTQPQRALLRVEAVGAACEVAVEVTDHWRGTPPPGSPPERGGRAVSSLRLAPPPAG